MIRCYFLGGSVDLGGSVVNIPERWNSPQMHGEKLKSAHHSHATMRILTGPSSLHEIKTLGESESATLPYNPAFIHPVTCENSPKAPK